jgi:hypothetical protein
MTLRNLSQGHPKLHIAEANDCLYKIAAKYGLLPEQVWGDAANAALRAKGFPCAPRWRFSTAAILGRTPGRRRLWRDATNFYSWCHFS